MVDINMTLVFQIFNFTVLVLLVYKFGSKPIMAMIDERKKKIVDDLENAKTFNEEAMKLKKDSEKQLEEALAEAENILNKAEETAKNITAEMIDKARAEQENILAVTKKEIEREKNEALQDARDKVVSLSVLVASKIIEKELDATTNKQLINSFFDEAKKEMQGEL